MKRDEIKITDIERLLLGEAPAVFLLEVLLRSLVTFVFLIVIMRLLGKRMSGKLTHTELSVMLMLGAIVSSAMQIPERGVLEGAFVLALVYLIQRSITYWTVKRQGFEDLTFGQMNLLVKDGVMQLDAMEQEKISRNKLFRLLRSKDIKNLGVIRRLYMETSGNFTVYLYNEKRPGLSVLPREDANLKRELPLTSDYNTCQECGYTTDDANEKQACRVCGNTNWGNAAT